MSFSSSLGRWTQLDPIGLEGGDSNLYRYEANSPNNNLDPNGLQLILPKPGEFNPGLFPALPPLPSPLPPTNRDIFQSAGKDSGCPDWLINLILDVAMDTRNHLPAPPKRGVHDYCDKWAEKFKSLLDLKLRTMGYKGGLSEAGGGCIESLEQKFWDVPGTFVDGHHSAQQIKFRNGATMYIDCGAISAHDANKCLSGTSHIGLPSDIPGHWIRLPRTNPAPGGPRSCPISPIQFPITLDGCSRIA